MCLSRIRGDVYPVYLEWHHAGSLFLCHSYSDSHLFVPADAMQANVWGKMNTYNANAHYC